MKSFFELREAVKSADRKPETYSGPDGKPKVRMVPVDKEVVKEKTLTPAEKKKREEIAKAIQRDNPDMPMDKKMAIATAQAKKVAEKKEYGPGHIGAIQKMLDKEREAKKAKAAVKKESVELDEVSSTTLQRYKSKAGKVIDNSENEREVKKRGKGYALASKKLTDRIRKEEVELDEARVVKGGYRDKDGKWHPPMTRDDLAKAAAAKRKEIHRKTAAAMREAKVDELSMSLKDLTKTGLNKAATKDKDKIKSDLAKLRARLNKKEDKKSVNEISDKMKDRYVQRAVSDHGHSNAVRKDALSRGDKDLAAKMKARMKKRNQGMTRAFGGERD
jgi:hypothetical protein